MESLGGLSEPRLSIKPDLISLKAVSALAIYPSADPAKSDFHLKSGSPALKAGRLESFSPITDLDGRLRPPNGPADLGAFQKVPVKPTMNPAPLPIHQ